MVSSGYLGRKEERVLQIVRSYLHTNGTMVIRDAPLEALEALEYVELSSPPFLALLVLSLRLYSPLKERMNL